MPETPEPAAAKPRQELRARIFWFMVGAVVNYIMISTPLKWLKQNTSLPDLVIPACALAFSTTFFFIWNYFVNFRTDSRKRDALARYVSAVFCMWMLSSTLLTYLKHHDFHHSYSLWGHALDLDVISTQFFLGGLKFVLYNFWVFPRAPRTPAPMEQPQG